MEILVLVKDLNGHIQKLIFITVLEQKNMLNLRKIISPFLNKIKKF